MICVQVSAIQDKAKRSPVGYLEDCRKAASIVKETEWCFEADKYAELAKKYSKFTRSSADPFSDRISGCCDRADQY